MRPPAELPDCSHCCPSKRPSRSSELRKHERRPQPPTKMLRSAEWLGRTYCRPSTRCCDRSSARTRRRNRFLCRRHTAPAEHRRTPRWRFHCSWRHCPSHTCPRRPGRRNRGTRRSRCASCRGLRRTSAFQLCRGPCRRILDGLRTIQAVPGGHETPARSQRSSESSTQAPPEVVGRQVDPARQSLSLAQPARQVPAKQERPGEHSRSDVQCPDSGWPGSIPKMLLQPMTMSGIQASCARHARPSERPRPLHSFILTPLRTGDFATLGA